MGRTDDARVLAAKQDIDTFTQALKLYRLDNQRYPSTEQGLQALITKPTIAPIPLNWKTGGYIDRLKLDPWGLAYQYQMPGTRGEVDVFSYGADGIPGGVDINADIGSWTS
jgi:general secretion pathway protein G